MSISQFTDKERKEIIAEYVECGSYAKVAKKHGVARSTIMRLCKKDTDTQQLATNKKEQNTKDMLEFMDSRKTKAQKLIDSIMENMSAKDKLKTASVRDLSIALGVVIDKFTMNENANTKEIESSISSAENVIIKIRKKAEEVVNES